MRSKEFRIIHKTEGPCVILPFSFGHLKRFTFEKYSGII